MARVRGGVSLFLAALALAACAKRNEPATPSQPRLPPGVRVFGAPYEKIWERLVEIVELRLLIPIDVADPSRGYFAGRWITDTTARPLTRARVSGSLNRTPEGVAVTIFREPQIWGEERWRSVPSDGTAERQILDLLSKSLAGP